MIRTNLSTRPFYNERAVHTWLLFMAALVAIATLFNVTRVLRYSRSDTQLAGEATRDENRAADLRQQAARLQAAASLVEQDRARKQCAALAHTVTWTQLKDLDKSLERQDARRVKDADRTFQGAAGTFMQRKDFHGEVEPQEVGCQDRSLIAPFAW